ncbi:MAG: phenylalanine--tRNA ligase subunit beta [Campylobacteraceae bacterium]|nr:phenylalanine--tRNA ligase subunit beta [Campylobacteraceae bacterium]
MIITRTWLQEFVDISQIVSDDICKTLNSIGLEVDSLEKNRIPAGVVVGLVTEKVKHPDADKLNICQVDLGSTTVQIVCGAKNVAEGQYVPVATVGCDLGNNFKIKKAKLRGVDSHGMICSSTELGLPKLNDGILELDSSIGELVLGKELNEFKLLNDDIIEIELTANRGDCLSINGVARELAAYYNLTMPEFEKNITYNDIGIGQVLGISSHGDLHSSFIFEAIDLEEFKLPLIYKIRLSIISKYENHDIKDVLTYAIHTNGVVLNTYAKDLCDVKDNLCVLTIKKGDKGFDNVYGKEELSTLCIAHKDIVLDSKSQYVLESSYANPEYLAKNVFEKKMKTGDIYYKTSRGSEPDIRYGIDYFNTLISSCGAKIYKGSESFTEDKEKISLDINTKKVNSIIGQEIKKSKIENILLSLGFEVKESIDDVFSIKVPLYRHDIKNIADITEEIVRIIGIDNIQSKPLAIDEKNRINATSIKYIKKNKIRAKAVENGFFETLTYVFANKEILSKYSFPLVDDNLDVLNPITNELNTYRTSLLPNLIQAVSSNAKFGFKSIAFFEIGTIFNEKREESTKISFVFSGEKEQEKISNSGKPSNIGFFEFAKKILNTIGHFDIEENTNIYNDFIHPFQNGNIIIDGKVVGYISKLHPSVASDFSISDTFIAEIDFDVIKNDLIKASKYSKFQASKKDLSLIVHKDVEYSKIKKTIIALKNENIKQFNLIDIYTDDKLGEYESLTIRFVLQNDAKTMEEEDITSTMDALVKILNEELSITLR